MIEVYTYNAGRGDCIRVRFAETHNIFIDSGVTRFAPYFKRICDQIVSNGESLDALILTHVDSDHIGGILMNLRHPLYNFPFQEVWMNQSGTASTGDTTLSARQNDEVYVRLNARGVTVRPMLTGNQRNIAGATIQTFWPDRVYKDLEKHQRRDSLLTHRNDFHVPLSILANRTIGSDDTSRSNKCSIVFSVAYGGRSILLTGDAWAEDVVRAKGDYDLIKLPHHGSVRNISELFPSSIRSTNFLICTNGVDHPDKQTIAKLEKWYGEINIYSPSDWWKKGYFCNDDRNHNINYFKKEGLVISW